MQNVLLFDSRASYLINIYIFQVNMHLIFLSTNIFIWVEKFNPILIAKKVAQFNIT